MTALRWALVLPAASVGLAVAQVVAIAVTAFSPDVFSRVVSALVTPPAFVILGARVAPSHRIHVAIVLAIAMVLLHGMLVGIALVDAVDDNAAEIAVSVVLGVIGTLGGVFFVYQQEPPSLRRSV